MGGGYPPYPPPSVSAPALVTAQRSGTLLEIVETCFATLSAVTLECFAQVVLQWCGLYCIEIVVTEVMSKKA